MAERPLQDSAWRKYIIRLPVSACHAASSWRTIDLFRGTAMTMLDRMRRHKNWLKWSLALVCLAFVLFYIPDFLRGTAGADAASSDTVAVVNGREVRADGRGDCHAAHAPGPAGEAQLGAAAGHEPRRARGVARRRSGGPVQCETMRG